MNGTESNCYKKSEDEQFENLNKTEDEPGLLDDDKYHPNDDDEMTADKKTKESDKDSKCTKELIDTWAVKGYQKEDKEFEEWIKTRLEDFNRKKKNISKNKNDVQRGNWVPKTSF